MTNHPNAPIAVCEGCDETYHFECHDPPLTDMPAEEWFCYGCAPEHRASNAESTASHDDDSADGQFDAQPDDSVYWNDEVVARGLTSDDDDDDDVGKLQHSFGPLLAHFSPPQHRPPCDVLCVMSMLIGCGLVLLI